MKCNVIRGIGATKSRIPQASCGLPCLKGRGKQQTPTKVSTTVRFDREVLDAFRTTGRGWQTRMNDALKEWLKEHTA